MSKLFRLFLGITLVLQAGCAYGPVTAHGGTGGYQATRLDLWVSSGCAKPGDTLAIRYTATNAWAEKTIIRLKDNPVMNIRITIPKRDGQVQIFWTDSKTLTDDLKQLVLEPGQSKSITMNWTIDPLVEPREYGGVILINGTLIYSEDPPGAESTGVSVFTGACYRGPFGP